MVNVALREAGWLLTVRVQQGLIKALIMCLVLAMIFSPVRPLSTCSWRKLCCSLSDPTQNRGLTDDHGSPPTPSWFSSSTASTTSS